MFQSPVDVCAYTIVSKLTHISNYKKKTYLSTFSNIMAKFSNASNARIKASRSRIVCDSWYKMLV